MTQLEECAAEEVPVEVARVENGKYINTYVNCRLDYEGEDPDDD